jgi:uncharacterized membrane protein
MARFSQRAQVALETVVLIVCAALVVAFYGALVALVVGVWATRNDITVRIGMTVFALAWFWPIVHGLLWRRARRSARQFGVEPALSVRDGAASGPIDREVDFTAFERQRQSGPDEHLDAGRRGRAASV